MKSGAGQSLMVAMTCLGVVPAGRVKVPLYHSSLLAPWKWMVSPETVRVLSPCASRPTSRPTHFPCRAARSGFATAEALGFELAAGAVEGVDFAGSSARAEEAKRRGRIARREWRAFMAVLRSGW